MWIRSRYACNASLLRTLHQASAWPEFDAELAKEEALEIPVQLNGKLIARVIVVSKRLVNVVAK
jgi:leucyl-tRNA synthetase